MSGQGGRSEGFGECHIGAGERGSAVRYSSPINIQARMGQRQMGGLPMPHMAYPHQPFYAPRPVVPYHAHHQRGYFGVQMMPMNMMQPPMPMYPHQAHQMPMLQNLQQQPIAMSLTPPTSPGLIRTSPTNSMSPPVSPSSLSPIMPSPLSDCDSGSSRTPTPTPPSQEPLSHFRTLSLCNCGSPTCISPILVRGQPEPFYPLLDSPSGLVVVTETQWVQVEPMPATPPSASNAPEQSQMRREPGPATGYGSNATRKDGPRGSKNKRRRQRQHSMASSDSSNQGIVPPAEPGTSASGSPPADVEVSAVVDNGSQGGRRGKPFCGFCNRNGETYNYVRSHYAEDSNGIVTCPVLRDYLCPICNATGDYAHTVNYCPQNPDKSGQPGRTRWTQNRNSRGIIGQYLPK